MREWELNQGEITFGLRTANSLSTSNIGIYGTIGQVRAVPTMIFIPLYHKIRIPLETVRAVLISFDRLAESFRELGIIELPKRLVWDIYLTTISQFKQSIFSSDWTGGRDKLYLLLKQMPRFIWRATAFCEQKPVLDLLFDATDIEHGSFLAHRFHITRNCWIYSKQSPQTRNWLT